MKYHKKSVSLTLSLFVLILICIFFLINITVTECSTKFEKIKRTNSYSSYRSLSHTQFKSAYAYPGKHSRNSKCNKGFGFDGICLGEAAELINFSVPDQIKDNWENNIMPILSRATEYLPFDACLGDFDGDVLLDDQGKLNSFQCHSIPYEKSTTMGVFGFNLKNLPCGTPTDFQMCLTFDRCGTVGVAVNGGSLKCLAFATGIGALISEVGSMIDYISFSFSLNKKLTQILEVPAFVNNEFRVKQVQTKGHFYLGMGLTLPGDFLKIGGIKLDKFFKVSVSASLLIDFGNTISTVQSIVKDITTNKGNGLSIVQKIMKSGAEVSLRGEGNVKINLESLTKGVIPNLSFNVGSLNILITAGGGESGLPTGLYIRLNLNVVKNLFDLLKKISSHFAGIMNAVGSFLKLDKIGDVEGSLAITSAGLGFEFKGAMLSIFCYYRIDTKKGSCKFNSSIFTMLLDAGKWVIKQAKKLFDDSGKELMRVTAKVGKFATQTAKEAVKIASRAVEEARNVAFRAANETEKIARMTSSQAASVAIDSAKKAEKDAKKAVEIAKRAAEVAKNVANKVARMTSSRAARVAVDSVKKAGKVAKKAYSKVKNAANKAKKFLSKWK
jgi:hypothetical protein